MIGTVVGGRPRTANTVKAGREKNKAKRCPNQLPWPARSEQRGSARDFKGLLHSLGDHVEQQRMPAKRLGKEELHRGEAFGEAAAGLAQVAANVDAGRQEIGNEDD